MLIAIVGESYANARQDNTRVGIYYRLKIELIEEMAPIARLLRHKSMNSEETIKEGLEYALKHHNAEVDPVHESQERTKKKLDTVEKKLAETREDLSETQQQLEKMMALLERVAAKLDVDAP